MDSATTCTGRNGNSEKIEVHDLIIPGDLSIDDREDRSQRTTEAWPIIAPKVRGDHLPNQSWDALGLFSQLRGS